VAQDAGKGDVGDWGKPADTGCGCAGGMDVSWLMMLSLLGLRRRWRVGT
jgi:hypothetical protein